MSRLSIETPGRAQTVLSGLYRDMGRRISASQPGLCPVDMSLDFLRLCHAQTCGKCVPCRVGLAQLSEMMKEVLDGEAKTGYVAIEDEFGEVGPQDYLRKRFDLTDDHIVRVVKETLAKK